MALGVYCVQTYEVRSGTELVKTTGAGLQIDMPIVLLQYKFSLYIDIKMHQEVSIHSISITLNDILYDTTTPYGSSEAGRMWA